MQGCLGRQSVHRLVYEALAYKVDQVWIGIPFHQRLNRLRLRYHLLLLEGAEFGPLQSITTRRVYKELILLLSAIYEVAWHRAYRHEKWVKKYSINSFSSLAGKMGLPIAI